MEIPVSEIREYLLPSNNPILKEIGIDTTFDECTCLDCSDAPIVSLPCGHKYHKICITPWIDRTHEIGPTCPICRRTMINNYEFWFKLGRETCNLSEWGHYCGEILNSRFGKSSKYSKLFDKDALSKLKGSLDDLIQQSYDRVEDPPFNEELKKYMKTTENVNCTYVFYLLHNIEKPEIQTCTGKYPKTLKFDQKQYIDKFRMRLNDFMKYMDFLVDNMPKPKNTERWFQVTGRHSMKNFKSYINKLKKWYEKLSVLDEINLS